MTGPAAGFRRSRRAWKPGVTDARYEHRAVATEQRRTGERRCRKWGIRNVELGMKCGWCCVTKPRWSVASSGPAVRSTLQNRFRAPHSQFPIGLARDRRRPRARTARLLHAMDGMDPLLSHVAGELYLQGGGHGVEPVSVGRSEVRNERNGGTSESGGT